MRVAVPTENGAVCPHFGHCEIFTIIDVDPETKSFRDVRRLNPPPHERGVIPAWLNQLGCTHIIAGGMGHRALALFEQNGVHVISGAPDMNVEEAVTALLNGELEAGANPCHDPGFRRHGRGHDDCQSGHRHEE
jgi:ATP-binding protein involved in chromosome partitioning